jgi:hypothetical protein
MIFAKATEIYRRGGREDLIEAIEAFSIATKAQILADIGFAAPATVDPDGPQEEAADPSCDEIHCF